MGTTGNDGNRKVGIRSSFLFLIFVLVVIVFIQLGNVHSQGLLVPNATAVVSALVNPTTDNEHVHSQGLLVPNATSVVNPTTDNAIIVEQLPRVLVLYFPQYHREPLNDKFWGDGFTDWDSLRAAPEKNRLGFDIPRPTELGYYDLVNTTTRKKQGELLRQYGIDGFAYHHYWFYDKEHPGPNLHEPLIQMLKDGYPDAPFCLHWCMVKWMVTWTSKPINAPRDGVLQKQFFPDSEDDPAIVEHYQWLKQFFHHPNYIKVQGKPVFMLYQKKPGSYLVLQALRKLAIEDGFPGLFFTVGINRPHEHLEYPGANHSLHSYTQKSRIPLSVFDKVVMYPNPAGWNKEKGLELPDWCQNRTVTADMKRGIEIPGIITSFDNTPRRNFDEAVIWSSDEPEKVLDKFRQSLYNAVYYETCCFNDNDDSRFIMINAWNEWAEGMTMEPSNVYGRKFLETVTNVKNKILKEGCNN